jgi:cobalamin biosynthesis protein CbiD
MIRAGTLAVGMTTGACGRAATVAADLSKVRYGSEVNIQPSSRDLEFDHI